MNVFFETAEASVIAASVLDECAITCKTKCLLLLDVALCAAL
jgi:hypothetical protein